jgi:hypothetical protein
MKMALFGKKKLSLEEILEGIKALSDEEKAKVVASAQGEAKPDPVETEAPVEDAGVEDANGEEVVEETATEEVAEEPATEPVTEEATETEPVEETTEESADVVLPESESATDEMAEDNRDQIIRQLSDKVNELSEQIKGLLELKSLMEEYTGKQAESFGYKGNVLGAKKDFKDMSTDELKAHAIKGI